MIDPTEEVLAPRLALQSVMLRQDKVGLETQITELEEHKVLTAAALTATGCYLKCGCFDCLLPQLLLPCCLNCCYHTASTAATMLPPFTCPSDWLIPTVLHSLLYIIQVQQFSEIEEIKSQLQGHNEVLFALSVLLAHLPCWAAGS